MRKNASKVYKMFHYGRPCREAESIWTDGETIYSYGTAIATVGSSWISIIMNTTKYSPTTSTHQNAIMAKLRKEGYHVVEVEHLPIGVSRKEMAPWLFSQAQEVA